MRSPIAFLILYRWRYKTAAAFAEEAQTHFSGLKPAELNLE
ncbi:hypothetical protein [Sinorhizobium meliloti]|nr:hypothetical protein [Sinorhizobium meliloti]